VYAPHNPARLKSFPLRNFQNDRDASIIETVVKVVGHRQTLRAARGFVRFISTVLELTVPASERGLDSAAIRTVIRNETDANTRVA
jgi:hypothetical protein